MPIILLAVIVVLLVVLMITGRRSLFYFRSVSYSGRWQSSEIGFVSEESTGSDDSSDSSETDEEYFTRMTQRILFSKPNALELDGYAEYSVGALRSDRHYKLVYAGSDEAMQVAPEMTDARYIQTEGGRVNTVAATDVTIYLRKRTELNSQEFAIVPVGDGSYYIISRSCAKMLTNVEGNPLLRDASIDTAAKRWLIKRSESDRYSIVSALDGSVLNMVRGQLSLEKQELLIDDAWFLYEISCGDWQSVFVDNFDRGVISAKWVKDGSMLTTKGSWTFNGGRIEIRARLTGSARAYLTSLTASGESTRIDILNADPATGEVTSCVSFIDGRTTEKHGVLGVGSTLGDWHEYAVEWDDGQIRFYFDGVLYSVFNITTNAARSSFCGTLMTLTIDGFSTPYADNIDCVKFRKRREDILTVTTAPMSVAPVRTESTVAGCHAAAALNDGFAVAAGDTVILYDTDGEKRQTVNGFGGIVTRLSVSGDGRKMLALCTGTNDAYIMDTATGKLTALSGHGAYVRCGGMPYGGSYCVTASHDGTVRVWNTSSGKETACISLGSWVRSVAVTNDGKRFAVGCNDGSIRIYNKTTGKLYTDFNAHGGSVTALCFSGGGTELASGDSDGGFMLWNVADSVRYYTSSHNLGGITEIDFASYGRYVVAAGEDGAVRAYEADTNNPGIAHALTLHGAAVSDIACGSGTITAGYDGKAYLCDGSFNNICELTGGSGFLSGCAVSADGRSAVVCSESGKICFYSL